MPWEIRSNYGGCSGYAVVKLPDGSVAGCHKTRDSARSQIRALYASESQETEKDTITNEVTPNRYPDYIGPKKRKVKKQMDLYDMLTPEEKAFHDALVNISEQYGPFNEGTSSIWVGYETARENENAVIGVKCGNCSFHYEKEDGGIACKIVSLQIEEEGKCRLAAIPDGLVNTEMDDDEMDMEMDNFVDDMMNRMGKADSVRVGQMVSWNSSGGRATGKVTRIIRNGKYNVPNSDFTITGTPDDPAVAIRVYRDGEPTDTIVGHKMSTLRSVSKSISLDIQEAIDILNSFEKAHNGKEKSMHEDEDDWDKRDYTTAQRREMASRGTAMPDGSFPIANRTDLANAIQSVGRASNYDAARRHIIGRARALDAIDMLPEDWNVTKSLESDSAEKTEVPKPLSNIFANPPTHARRAKANGSTPINLNLFREEK